MTLIPGIAPDEELPDGSTRPLDNLSLLLLHHGQPDLLLLELVGKGALGGLREGFSPVLPAPVLLPDFSSLVFRIGEPLNQEDLPTSCFFRPSTVPSAAPLCKLPPDFSAATLMF